MLDFIESLKLDKNVINKVTDLAQKDKVNVLMCAQSCNKGDFECLKDKSDLFRLAVIIECLSHTKSEYERLNIEDKIFFDTMTDIKIWCENNSNDGIKNYNWIKNHLMCQLFKIGRLQYQLYVCDNETLNYDLLPFDYGAKLVYVHIPQGERLNYADCVNSLQSAIKFFDLYFSDFEYEFFFSESWLLYEDNWLFMERSSNILEFSTLFDVMYNVDDDTQAIERIFGKRRKFISLYPAKTSLQKNAKAHLQKGGKLGIGIGIIEKQCFE